MGPFIQRPKVVIEFGLKSENVQKGSQRRRGVVDPRENEKALKIKYCFKGWNRSSQAQAMVDCAVDSYCIGNIDVWLT